jgi:GNAT superfamily N-acetyltransferase
MIEIRPITQTDRPAWEGLYADYAAFYKVVQTPQMRAQVWAWLMDPAHEVNGLVAQTDMGLIGLAHFRPFARPLSASTGGFLDDLFVSPEVRGTGAGRALIASVADIARAKEWTVLRWITADSNQTARALYDKVAVQTPWVTYDIKL